MPQCRQQADNPLDRDRKPRIKNSLAPNVQSGRFLGKMGLDFSNDSIENENITLTS